MAGSIVELAPQTGSLLGSFSWPIGLPFEFTADAADGLIPSHEFSKVSGGLLGFTVVFDGTTPPNSLTILPQTVDGVSLAGFFDSLIFTASGQVLTSNGSPIPVAGGLTLVLSGNTTNSAKAKIIALFIGG